MFPFLYIEKEVEEHPKVQELARRFSKAQKVRIDRYGEVFNRKGQNFRLQKEQPSLILAKKKEHLVLKIPEGYGIGTKENFYFSHLLNCPFDCRYCFLQGMYTSAFYVLFVNFEDFQSEIKKKESADTTFFTGYDCDSLALETVTHFAKDFLPFIKNSSAFFEFRTKSAHIKPFLEHAFLPNCIISWTLSPEKVQKEWEHKTVSLEKRLEALEALQEKGWRLGIRFDPLIEFPGWQETYPIFFNAIFSRIKEDSIHSVTLGSFRAPKEVFKKMSSLYPEEVLFARGLKEKKNQITFINESFLSFCKEEVLKYISSEKLFLCHE